MTQRMLVVGVDGSDGGRRALAWALHEAERTGDTVLAVLVWSWDGVDILAPGATNPGDARRRAEQILTTEVDDALASTKTTVPIAREIVEGRPATELTRLSRDAHLLVLGSHGHNRLRHAVLGSVGAECVRLAGCPVVVVPVPLPARRTEKEPAVPA